MHAQVALHRPFLVRIARRSLQNEAWADDAVSETVLAALERPQAWAGRAQARTWLVAILKHKLVDQIRRHARESPIPGPVEGDDPDEPGAARSDVEMAAGWGDPMEALARRQLMRHLTQSLSDLAPRHARALLMSDWVGEDTGVICHELGVTANNLGVMLHRARRRMRGSLQDRGVCASSAG